MATITFPTNRELMLQSSFLYLQSAGSTGADGSTYGAHARWMLLGNLGEMHLPKGDQAKSKINFNRAGDYVTLYRSPYIRRFPTIIDFAVAPNVVNDALAFWIYTVTNTQTVVYIHFRDPARYAAVRGSADPAAQPLAFIEQYCPAVIEVEVKDKLFFAAEFDVARSLATRLRVEALSVESNVPLSPVLVSCRRTFDAKNWCPADRPAIPADRDERSAAVPPAAPKCCGGTNLLTNGGFELPPIPERFGFETDYQLQIGRGAGVINVVRNAPDVNPAWVGRPHSGDWFLIVNGSEKKGAAFLRFRMPVEPQTSYCFSGWLSTLYSEDLSVPLQIRFTGGDGKVQTFDLKTPGAVSVWEPFSINWLSGTAESVVVELTSLLVAALGNDFGIDDLWFCRSVRNDCRARIRSENVRSLRFDVTAGYPRRIELETYREYIAGASWTTLDRLALTTDDNVAFQRLEPAAGSVHGQWQKFNDQARVNTANYQDRWTRAGGLKKGVQEYISRSEVDPRAIAPLAGDAQQDGTIQVSMLDALRLVSLDFHIARMFGLGYLDRAVANDSEEFIYLAEYDTDGALDDGKGARPVRHYFMGVPTRPLDHRLPPPPRLEPVKYGLPVGNGETQPPNLTDDQGYTPDGLARYVNLSVAPDTGSGTLGPFFVPPDEFCAIDATTAVFYGVEYRKQGQTAWRTPEIAHDLHYLDPAGQFETLPLPNNPAAIGSAPILRHEERENGTHEYGGYGINWFSRASKVGNVVVTDATFIRKAARLLPPANFAVQLIQPESPRMLTTAAEQAMLGSLSGDTTLVRVTFDYYHVHDINYAFANEVELFFRSAMPRNVVGAVKSVSDDPSDARKAVLRTTAYTLNSQGTTVTPTLASTLFQNFRGGVLTCQGENYIIADVVDSTVAGEGPVFTIEKFVKGSAADPSGTGAYVTVNEYVAPVLPSNAQVMFMAVENMASATSWSTPNPLPAKVKILPSSPVHQDTYVRDGEMVTRSLRGIREPAAITSEGPGLYRIALATPLAHHPQYADLNPVDWYKGAVRVARTADPNGPKKVLDVLIVENVGNGQPLVLHALDNEPADLIQTGTGVIVNYYPGYRLYLHADAAYHFDASTIQPAAGEGTRKTWLGARATDTIEHLSSAVGIPAPIVAVELIPALAPAKPLGPEYATWPDFYYKSSYTFTIDFAHKPFAAAMYRSNDEAILRALYKDDTYAAVRQQLNVLGEDDPHRAGRWQDLLGFTYSGGTFATFGGYAFPNPDRGGPLDGSAPGSIVDAVKDAVIGAFTALTEQPLIYDFIKGPAYVPVPKAQTIRNSQGTLLPPSDPEFDLAPMARRTGNNFEIQFTDFTLDGTGNNIFFYFGREIGNRGRLGDPGPIAGPVLLINTRPPDAPAVQRMYVAELPPAVHFEVNAYPEVQRVRRMLVYRATDAARALSVRTMELVKTIDLKTTGQLGKLGVLLTDDFESGFVPFGDPLFYRIVALRKIRKPDGSTEWAPSQPSKVLLTTIIDSTNPPAPEITWSSNGLSGSPQVLTNVELSWPPTAYNGTYYLDTMTAVGSWRAIHTIKTNQSVTVNLAATALGTNVLPKEDDDDGRELYSRFRVRVENSSGLFNLADNVLIV
jgi:hypothetical protein